MVNLLFWCVMCANGASLGSIFYGSPHGLHNKPIIKKQAPSSVSKLVLNQSCFDWRNALKIRSIFWHSNSGHSSSKTYNLIATKRPILKLSNNMTKWMEDFWEQFSFVSVAVGLLKSNQYTQKIKRVFSFLLCGSFRLNSFSIIDPDFFVIFTRFQW